MSDKTGLYVAGVLGLAVGGFVLYKVLAKPDNPDDANAATKNPWRGTGLSCEAEFDAMSLQNKTAIVAIYNAMPPNDPRYAQLHACKVA